MTDFIYREQIEETAAAIRRKITVQPKIGVVLGSGLSTFADEIRESTIIPAEELPHWPVSTAPGHKGRLVIGRLGEQAVIMQQGRAHFYEGYSMAQITLPARVFCLLGIEVLVLTNAAGGLNPSFQSGDLMLIRDHINFPGLAGHNPLRGPNEPDWGPRFPDMTHPYDPELRQLARPG